MWHFCSLLVHVHKKTYTYSYNNMSLWWCVATEYVVSALSETWFYSLSYKYLFDTGFGLLNHCIALVHIFYIPLYY